MTLDYRKAGRFVWFTQPSLTEWKEYLDAGADRVEVHEHGTEATVSFFKDGVHLGTVNESHICPIDCG